MKSVSSGLGKDLNEYAKRAMDAVFTSFANGIERVVYDSTMKAPYVTRSEIAYGGVDKDNVGVRSFPSFEEKVDNKFSGIMEKRAEKIIGKLDEALKAGEINEAHYNQNLFSEMKNLHYEFAKRNNVYKKNFLSFAEYDILRGVPQNMVAPESHRNLGGMRAAGMSDFLENNIAEARIIPGKSTPHKIEHRSETYTEKYFYKAMKFLTDEVSYVEKGIYKRVDWVVGGLLDSSEWLAKQMSKHPLIVGAATVTGVVGLGIAADYKYNEGKTVKSIGDYSKSAGKSIAGGVSGVFAGFGDLFNKAPAVVPANASAVATPQVSGTAYQFTPDIIVHGSDGYKTWIKKQLEELDKTPDFKIRGMTARQYTEKYIEDLYEALPGTLEGCPQEAIGKTGVKCLSKSMSPAGNLLHVARHNEQAYELKDIFQNKSSYEFEEDAVKFQSEWMAAKNNWTEEQRLQWFETAMKQYEVWKPK